MSLIRKAKGLQRFMLDCGWWRSKNWAGVGLDVIGLQTCAISYCHEHGTDGRLPMEDLALALGLREKEVKAAVAVAVRKGRWAVVGEEYEIVGFADHNPLQAEIDDFRAKKAASGVAGNHKKWHVDRNVVDPECSLCAPPKPPPPSHNGSQVRSPTDPNSEENPSHPGSLSSAVFSSAVPDVDPSRNHHGGLAIVGNDERDQPQEPPPPRLPDPIVERLLTAWPEARRRKLAGAALAVVAEARRWLDAGLIDEVVGHMLAMTPPPGTPRYLLTVAPDWAQQRGANLSVEAMASMAAAAKTPSERAAS